MSKANNRAAADTFLAVALGVLRKSYYLCQQEETTQENLMNSSLFTYEHDRETTEKFCRCLCIHRK